jgi:hypothetical protein
VAAEAIGSTIPRGFQSHPRGKLAPEPGQICWLCCSTAVAGGERLVIGVAFDGTLELGDALTPCPETTSAEKSKPSLIVNTDIRNICPYLQRLELDLTHSFWR